MPPYKWISKNRFQLKRPQKTEAWPCQWEGERQRDIASLTIPNSPGITVPSWQGWRSYSFCRFSPEWEISPCTEKGAAQEAPERRIGRQRQTDPQGTPLGGPPPPPLENEEGDAAAAWGRAGAPLSHSLSCSSLCPSAKPRLATYLLSYIFSCWAFGRIPWKSVLL